MFSTARQRIWSSGVQSFHSEGVKHVVLHSHQAEIIDAVTTLAVALHVEVTVTSTVAELRVHWSDARLRLVDSEQSHDLADAGISGPCWVVGTDTAQLVAASAALDAPALTVPDRTGRLAKLLVAEEPSGVVIAVSSASGGVGCSTFAAGLAVRAAKAGPTALVELAPSGGGIDLLLGAEHAPGLRWSQLAGASGELGQLDGLVHAFGVDVVPLDRQQPGRPASQAVEAVLQSLRRSHSSVIVDAGSVESAGMISGARHLIIVPADVRGVAAARMVTEEHPWLAHRDVVARLGKGRDLPADAVAGALGMSLLGTLRTDPMIPRLSADGSSVAAPVARRFTRDVQRCWEVIAA